MRERTIHKGPCGECGRPMVDQREWRRNRSIRVGRVKAAGYGRCAACYRRGNRRGVFPRVTISARYPVACDRCGPVGERSTRREANQLRLDHLETHGVRPVSSKLSGAELARLRQMVGAA
jgi:hypothetical protein